MSLHEAKAVGCLSAYTSDYLDMTNFGNMLLVNFTFFLDILLHILHILAMMANGVNLGGLHYSNTDVRANANLMVLTFTW